MNAKEIVKQNDSALQKMLSENQAKLQEKRFGLAGAAKTESSVKLMRKTIARIKTEQTKRAKEAAATK